MSVLLERDVKGERQQGSTLGVRESRLYRYHPTVSQKNKSLLLNVLGNEDNYLNVKLFNRIFYEVDLIMRCCIYLQL